MTHKPKSTKAMMRMIGSRNLAASVRHLNQLTLFMNDDSINQFYLSTIKFDQIMIYSKSLVEIKPQPTQKTLTCVLLPGERIMAALVPKLVGKHAQATMLAATELWWVA